MSTPLKIGPKSAAWLRQVGIRSHEDLVEIGAVAAFVKCKRAGFRPTMNLLYSLEALLVGCHWQKLPAERRAELQALAEAQIALIPPSRARAAALVVTAVRDVTDDAGPEPDFEVPGSDPEASE